VEIGDAGVESVCGQSTLRYELVCLGEKQLLTSQCLSGRPSVRMEQLGSHWTDFHEVWYLSIFRNIVENFDVFLTVHRSMELFQITKLMHNSFIL
jgi:hypothetical protein